MTKKLLLIIFLSLFSAAIFASTSSVTPSTQAQKNNEINLLVSKYHFKRAEINNLFAQAKKDPKVIACMTKPAEKGSWKSYQNFFVTQARIDNGATYWHEHRAALARMQKKYGVTPGIAVAIIGVETAYGTHMGKYPVFNTLYTLAFYYPKQAHFFQQELALYLVLARNNHLPITTLKGSYAGAVGIPQFMPSSYLHYGVPGGDYKTVNLFTNNNDAIASIGNYLKLAGFKKNHFKAILAYNHSTSYATVVTELSKAIKKQYQHEYATRS